MALDTNDVSLQVTTPPVLRNGEFFETRIRVTAGRWLGNAVVAVSPGLWRDVTVDTLREQRARRDSLTRAEVESEMRLAGIARMSEVGWAVLEPKGKISFIRASAGSEPAEQRDEDGAR